MRLARAAVSGGTTMVVALGLAVAAAGSAAKLDSLPADRGDFVIAFAFDGRARGSVYAATIGGGVFRSRDAGRSWEATATTGSGWSRIDAFAADPLSAATLYAGTGVAVYKTADGGGSWRGASRGLLPPPPVIAPGQVTATPGHRESEGWVTALAIDPGDSDVVWAGTGGGVRKSTDGGGSWRTVLWHGRYMTVSALVIAPTSPQAVYAAAFTSGPPGCGAGGTVPCRNRERLYRTTDGGRTWRATRLLFNPAGYPGKLALDPLRPATLYAAAGRAVVRSTDGGRSWQSIGRGLPARRQITSLVVDPRQSGTVYVGLWARARAAGKGVFKTTDGGRTWRRAGLPLPVTALAVDSAQPATIYAGVDGGELRVVRSADGGRTWTRAG